MTQVVLFNPEDGLLLVLVLAGEKHRDGFAVEDGVELMDLPAAGPGDDDPRAATFPKGQGAPLHGEHPEDVVPDAGPVVAVLRVKNGLLDESEDLGRHDTGAVAEVLPGDLLEVADLGVDQDAVLDRFLPQPPSPLPPASPPATRRRG